MREGLPEGAPTPGTRPNNGITMKGSVCHPSNGARMEHTQNVRTR